MAFNINAAVVLSGPKNIQKVSNSIRKQLSGINVPVKVQLDKKSASGLGRINTQLKGLNTTLSTLQKNAVTTTSSFNALANSTRGITGAATKVNSATNQVNKSLAKTAQSAKVAGSAMQTFGKDAALAVRRFAAFSLATGVIFGFTRAVSQATKEAIQFERELVKITQVTGKAGKDLQGLTRTVDELATGLGLSANELLGVGRTFAQTGQSLNQVEKSLRAVAKASLAPTFGDIQKTTEGAIAALNQFKLGADQLEGVLGSLNQVSKKFAVESDDLISVIRRAGGVFAASTSQLGAPEERLRELIGIFTAVRSTTRESADTIATGLRTIFTRIQRPQTIEFLKQFGVQLRATKADAQALGVAEGEFIGIFEALKRISKASKGLDTLQTARLVEELGGVRQVGKLIPALQNFEKAELAVQEALKGRGSVAKDVALATQTLAVQFEQLQQRFGKLIRDISQSSTFQNLAKFAIQTANAFITLADALRPILPALTAIAAVKIGAGSIKFAQGFLGGIRRGGGAAGVGGGLANIATGGAAGTAGSQAQQTASKKQATASLTKNTTALNSNTTALKTLNTTINALNKASTTLNASAGKLTTQASTLNATLTSLPAKIASATRVGGGGGPIPISPRRRGRAAGGSIPKFADGGFVKGPSHAQGGVVAELEGGELVVPKKQAKGFAFGGLTRAAVTRVGSGRALGKTSDLFAANTAANAKFPLQTTTGFGKFLNKVELPGDPTAPKAQRFGNLPPSEQKRLVKEFRGQSQKGGTAGVAANKNAQAVQLRLNPASFAGLFLTGSQQNVGERGISPSNTAQKLLVEKARKSGFPRASRVTIGGIAQQFVSTESKRRKGIDDETKIVAKEAFKSATKAALASPSLQIGEGTPYKVADGAIDKAVEPLFQKDGNKVNSAQGAIQGYLLEGILGAMTNIAPQSAEATFDFIFKGGKANYGGLADFFDKDVNLFKGLTAADARRAASKGQVQGIYRKAGDYLSVNRFGDDASFVAAAQGMLIPGDGMTPVRVSNGEGVIAPDVAKGNLADLEKARKGNREAISRIANLKLPISRIKGKGTGTSDSIEGELPANSFVLPTSTMKKLQKPQNLRIGGVAKAVGKAVKADPTTAIFLGFEASLLASSKSAEEFKGNLINAGLTLAFLAPQLKEFAAAIKKNAAELSKSAGAQASASTRGAPRKLTANEKFFENIRRGNAVLKGGAVNPALGTASGRQLSGSSQALGSVAKDKVAKANALIDKSNKATANAVAQSQKYNALAAKNNAAVNELNASTKKLSGLQANRATLATQQKGLQTKLSGLESKRAALINSRNKLSTDLASREKELSRVTKARAAKEAQLRDIKSSQGVRGAKQFSQGQIQSVQDEVNRLANQERTLTRQTSGGARGNIARAEANLQKQIAALDDQIKPLNKGVSNLGGKIGKLDTQIGTQTKVVADNTKTARAAQSAAKSQRTVALNAIRDQRTARGAATSARGVAKAATGRLRDFNTLARAEQGRRALVAGARASRIAGKGGLSRAARFERVRGIREARFAAANPGARNPFAKGRFGFKGFQVAGQAGRVGGTGLAGFGARAGSIAKAGLGGPGGIAALVASLFGDAVVNAGTEAIVGKQKEVAGARGFSKSQGGRSTAATTGALKGGISGAATGASIGLLTGPLAPILTPVFAAVGGLVGTIDGVLGGLKGQLEFETLEQAQIAGEKLSKALDDLAEKGFKNVDSLDAVTKASQGLVSQVVDTSARLNQLTISGRQTAIGTSAGQGAVFGLVGASGGAGEAFAKFSDELSLGFNVLGKVVGQTTGTGVEGFSNSIGAIFDAFVSGTDQLSKSENVLLSFYGSVYKGALELAGFDVGARTEANRQRVVGASQLINAENFQRSLIAIPQEALDKASTTFQALGPAIANSISIDKVAEIAGQGSGSFDDLLESLEAASDGSKEFEAQLNALKGLAGTEALNQAKQLSATFAEIAAAGKDQGREGALKTLFAIGENSAQAFVQGINSGSSFEESGQLAGEKFIAQLQQRVGRKIDFKELGIDDLEDLQNKLKDSPGLLQTLATSLGVQAGEVQTLIGQTDSYIASVENQITAQIAAEQKQRLVNDLLRSQAQGLDAFAAALEDLDARVGNIVSDFTTTASNVQQEVSRIFSSQQSVQAVGRANVFAGGGRGRSREELAAGVERVRASIGGRADDFADLPDTITLGNRLPQALKDTVDQIDREGGKFTFEDVKDKLIENINAEGDIFSGLSDPVKGQFEAALEAIFVGLRQGGEELGIDGIKAQLEEFGNIQSQFTELSQQTASVLENVTSNLNTFNAAILESANLVVEASRQRVDAELDVLNRNASFEDQFGKFRTGERDSLSKANSRFAARQATLLNAGGSGTATVGGVNLGTVGGGNLLDRRTELEGIRRGLLDKLGEVTGVDTTNAADAIQAAQGVEGADQLISELGNTTAALEGTKRAIEEATNETARLAAIEDRLASINETRLNERQRLQAGLKQLEGARTPQERNKILNEIQRPFIAASKLAAGQALTVQEGSALQADLLQGNTGIVANAFRQQNPGATEEEIADFVERSLANFQIGGQNLFRGLGLGADATAAIFGTATGPGATAKGETDQEKSLLSQAEKIQQEQVALVQGYVEQNTDLLAQQQDIYKQKIIETTAALATAAEAFSSLRDKEQELLALSQQRLEQTKQVALEEAKVEEEKKLDTAQKSLDKAQAAKEETEARFAKAQGLAGQDFNSAELFFQLRKASGFSAESAAANAEKVFNQQNKSIRDLDIKNILASDAASVAFGDLSSKEAIAFQEDLFNQLEAAQGSRDIVGDSVSVGKDFTKIITDALAAQKAGFLERTNASIAGDQETVRKSKESIAAKDAEIKASKDAQVELKKKADEEAANREAAKKAREEAAKQQAATATSPAGIGPAEAAERQRQADRDKRFAEIRGNLSATGVSVPNGPGISEERRAEIAANARAEDEAAIAAARQQDRAAIGGGGQFNVRDGVSLANKGRTLEKQTTGAGGNLGSLTDPIPEADQAASDAITSQDVARVGRNTPRTRQSARLASLSSTQQKSGGARLARAQSLLESRKGLLEKRGGELTEDERGELDALKAADKANREAGAGFSISDESQKRLRSLQERDRLTRDIASGERQVAALGGSPLDAASQSADQANRARNEAAARNNVVAQTEGGIPTQQRQQQQQQQQVNPNNNQAQGQQTAGVQTLLDAVNAINTSTFATDLLTAAERLSNLQTLNINFEGSVKPIEVILNGGGLLKEMKEGVKQELIPLISDAVQKQLQNLNL